MRWQQKGVKQSLAAAFGYLKGRFKEEEEEEEGVFCVVMVRTNKGVLRLM